MLFYLLWHLRRGSAPALAVKQIDGGRGCLFHRGEPRTVVCLLAEGRTGESSFLTFVNCCSAWEELVLPLH